MKSKMKFMLKQNIGMSVEIAVVDIKIEQAQNLCIAA